MKVILFRRSVKYLLVVLVLAILAAAVNADHGSVPPLHQFNAGTPAKASEVNENFAYLEDRSWDRTQPATDLFYMGGNVSIGKTTPGAKLEVKFSGASGGTNSPIKFGDDFGFAFLGAGSDRIFFTDGSGNERLAIALT